MSNVMLYHFTSEEYLSDIVLDGVLKPRMTPEHAEHIALARFGQFVSDRPSRGPNVSHAVIRAVPPVVWFTVHPMPGWCCEPRRGRRWAVRITVELRESEVQDFGAWAAKHGLAGSPPRRSSGNGSEHRVVEGPVKAPWVAIDYMHRDGLCPVAQFRSMERTLVGSLLAPALVNRRITQLGIEANVSTQARAAAADLMASRDQ